MLLSFLLLFQPNPPSLAIARLGVMATPVRGRPNAIGWVATRVVNVVRRRRLHQHLHRLAIARLGVMAIPIHGRANAVGMVATRVVNVMLLHRLIHLLQEIVMVGAKATRNLGPTNAIGMGARHAVHAVPFRSLYTSYYIEFHTFGNTITKSTSIKCVGSLIIHQF